MPEETQRATRLRPEEILARSFATPVLAESNGADGWSPRARRLFLVALALAGAILVTAGLLLTGELGPAPGRSSPLQTGADPGAIAGSLLPRVDQPEGAQPPATPAPPTPTTAPGNKPRTQSPIVVAPSQTGGDNSNAQTTATTQALRTDGTTPPRDDQTTTTLPCDILGSRSLGAQIPPLCR